MNTKSACIVASLFFAMSGCTEDEGEPEKEESVSSEESVPAKDEAASSEEEPENPMQGLLEELGKIESFEEAIAVTRPHMGDTHDEMSDGAFLLGMWAAENLRWQDVHVEDDETSFGMIKKHSEPERGKRMCWTGRIVQIAREDLGEAGGVYTGLLMTRRHDIIHFVAAGSTGELVEESRARFCGAATGQYSYSNSGGGTSHAVQMVGMFRVPENLED